MAWVIIFFEIQGVFGLMAAIVLSVQETIGHNEPDRKVNHEEKYTDIRQTDTRIDEE